jgi:hypothetical protein
VTAGHKVGGTLVEFQRIRKNNQKGGKEGTKRERRKKEDKIEVFLD